MHCVVVIIRVQSANYHLHMWFHSVHKVAGYHWERLLENLRQLRQNNLHSFDNYWSSQTDVGLFVFYNRNSVNKLLVEFFNG